jgi:hypothetical protein
MIYSQENNGRRLLFVGGGRLSHHLQFYFGSLGHHVKVVSARHLFAEPERYSEFAASEWDAVFLLCRDRDIARAFSVLSNKSLEFYLRSKHWVHCSGALRVAGVESWHPLASFSSQLFDSNFYTKIPFVGSTEGPSLVDILPDFPNPFFRIDPLKKPLYHALCVLSGNLSSMLWNHAANRFTQDLGLPNDISHVFARSVLENFIQLGAEGQSGPLTRGDRETLAKNLEALKGDPFSLIFNGALETSALCAHQTSLGLNLKNEGNEQ